MESIIKFISGIILIAIGAGFAFWLFALIGAWIKEEDEGMKKFVLFMVGIGIFFVLLSQCAGCKQ